MSHLSEDFLLDPGPDSVGTLRLRLTVLVGVVALNLEVRLCPKLSRDVELGDEIVHEHLLPLVPAEVQSYFPEKCHYLSPVKAQGQPGVSSIIH